MITDERKKAKSRLKNETHRDVGFTITLVAEISSERSNNGNLINREVRLSI